MNYGVHNGTHVHVTTWLVGIQCAAVTGGGGGADKQHAFVFMTFIM